MDVMLGFGSIDTALAVNREVLGLFFAISGYHKLFNAKRHASLVATMNADKVGHVGVMQWFVPLVELFGGIALVVGLLSVLAALGLGIICAVATCVDGLRRIAEWVPIDRADFVDDVLYLQEVLYIVMLSVVVLAGPGSFSLDFLLFGPK